MIINVHPINYKMMINVHPIKLVEPLINFVALDFFEIKIRNKKKLVATEFLGNDIRFNRPVEKVIILRFAFLSIGS